MKANSLSILNCLILPAILIALPAAPQELPAQEVRIAPSPEGARKPGSQPVAPALPEYVRDQNPATAEGKPMIQIAVLLDTSSSMQGLIDQAKAQLWKIVNELGTLKREGEDPILQIALYEYGRNTLPKANEHVKKVAAMTTDLDTVYEKLLALNATTSAGSNEQCGRVIHQAAKELGWSKNNNDLKVIFIAGNESFAQGSLSYELACKTAIEQGVTINTIFCGSKDQGIRELWEKGAELADGTYLNIDHNRVATRMVTPQDKEIVALNEELNGTYLARGVDGEKARLRQSLLDQKAEALSPETAVDRAVSKSGKYYDSTTWDLVDAVSSKNLDLANVNEKELPEEMRKMSLQERKAHIKKLQANRSRIQTQIRELSGKRDAFIAERKSKQADASVGDPTAETAAAAQAPEQDSLNSAIISGLKKAAAQKNFKLEPEKKPVTDDKETKGKEK